jgi:hypothetical protein
MRNAGFIMAVAAALGVGTLIGWYAIPTLAPAVFVQEPDEAVASAGGLISGASAQMDSAAADLRFSIDTTRPSESASGSSPYRPSGTVENTTCSMPSARDALVVVFGVYEGQALSTVALGSRDEVTGVLDVVIERGDRPLYIVLSAYAGTIWRFSGDVDRVQRVVLVAGRSADPQGWSPLAGVVGLPADVVATADPERCFTYAYDPGSLKAAQVSAIVRRAVGKDPDVFGGYYDLAAVRLPSGKGAQTPRSARVPPPTGYDADLWREMLRFNPAGLVAIDPDAVVSAARVQPYDVLPQQAGLSQLVGSGDLLKVSDGLKVVRRIARFPAGLSGAHSTAFLIARGVPLPAGHPGHSAVIMESTGRPPEVACAGSRCGPGRDRARPAPAAADAGSANRTAAEAARVAEAAARAAAAAAGTAAADRPR